MKKSTFILTIILLMSILVTLVGYNELVIRKESLHYQELNTQSQQDKKDDEKTTKSMTIHCIGDSLTLGSKKSSYPQALSSLGNFSVDKFGGNQDQTMDLSIRLGGTNIYVNNVTIPATPTPVDITIYDETNQEMNVLKGTGNNFSTVEIAGVAGKLDYDYERQIHTFTRTQKGDEITITSLTPIVSDIPQYDKNDIFIIFTGTYDPYVQNSIFQTITYQRNIISQLKTDKYIIVSLTSKRRFQICHDMNVVLQEEHQDHFLDFRTYLLEHGLEDAHLTPTPQDEQDLLNGYIPSSLLNNDQLNGNHYFNELLAQQLILKMIELGYIDQDQIS